jgi:hypothetical protein
MELIQISFVEGGRMRGSRLTARASNLGDGSWVCAFEEEDEGQFRNLWGVESPRAN